MRCNPMWIALLLAAAGMSSLGQAQGAEPPTAAPGAQPPNMTPAAELTKADVDSWLDGFMPYAIELGDIAGAVVVVVKDGAVLSEKGFGYADVAAKKPVDPRTTLFRPGSTSKLFTWTAVMQQVELGKLDLDRDVNEYLDFRIPPYDGKPVTLRNIMTHTGGFEEAARDLIVTGAQVPPLDSVLKAWTPARIFPPGVTPAYSNYAAALAGYIVQRVSGEPFDSYIERHIFQPLGMEHSTFTEPLPSVLAPDMSQGYARGSEPPKPFEMITVRPAGSGSMAAGDLARFMLAHLDEEHGVLLKPETARQMHGTALTLMPPLNRMELGFYESNLNGRKIIGHGGDTQWFHSDLWLIPQERTGMFVSVNSAGRDGAAYYIREALIGNFMNRYFPAASASTPAFKVNPADAAAVAGTYIGSRRSESGSRRALNFITQVTIGAEAAGGLHITDFAFQGINGAPRNWVEIAPFVWKDQNGSERLAAQVRDGKVVRVAVDSFPFEVYDRVPWYSSTAWLMPATIGSAVLLMGFVISAPFGWMARRLYAAPRRYQGGEARAYRLTWMLALAVIVALAVWSAIILTLRFTPLSGAVYLLQVATLLALPALCVASAWFLATGSSGHRGVASIGLRGLIVLASVCMLWVAVAFNLTHVGLHF